MITNNFDMYLLENPSAKFFQPKQELTSFEKYGLKKALVDFVIEYETEQCGKSYTDIESCIRYNESSVTILDGGYNTYIFDKYAINNLQVTNEGLLLLNCYEVTPNRYGEYLPENITYNKEVVFRLN